MSGKVSASERPQFKALLGQIRDGETLVVSKLNRLGPDAQDVGATIKALAARRIEVIVLQLGKLDLTSPAGKLMLTILAAGRHSESISQSPNALEDLRPTLDAYEGLAYALARSPESQVRRLAIEVVKFVSEMPGIEAHIGKTRNPP